VKTDPFAPQLLIDYELYCRANGSIDFGTYMTHWYLVTKLLETTEKEGRDPFELTVEDIDDVCSTADRSDLGLLM